MRASCTGSRRRRRPPSSWAAAFFAAAADWASMRSMTGFRLRQVHFAVEEGPLGEFTGLGLPGSGGKEGGEQGVEDYGRAVAVEFCRVLPGIAVAATEADG